jgi:hypothetical protein|tara:strand:- start:429 stop:587 length:159 start_codon:yes stop_codon:yes gene_type:complete
MHISDYVRQAKAELDEMEKEHIEEHAKTPEQWPLEMNVGEWGDQELAARFGD